MNHFEIPDPDELEPLDLLRERGKRAAKFQTEKREPLHRHMAFITWYNSIPVPKSRIDRRIWYETCLREFGLSELDLWRTNRYCSCAMCSEIKASDRRRARHKVHRDMRHIVRTGQLPEVLPLYERQYTD